MEKEKNIKLGHQAPKKWRHNVFTRIEINGDFHYCNSHNFIYNKEEEQRKLYNGEPCYYTDGRFFESGFGNSYKRTTLHWNRRKPISLKAAIRRINSCKGIPNGTIVNFEKDWYYPGKKVSGSYLFKVKKENPFDIKFEISKPSYSRNFSTCEWSQKLVEALRDNGFVVSVTGENPNRLSSMISQASLVKNGEYVEPYHEEGEIAIAYGHGKKIGISSHDNTLFGYTYAIKSILWDRLGYFNKWSQCNEILKTTPIEEIVEILMAPNPNEDEEY